jgi:CheY-like chemotaxis protein
MVRGDADAGREGSETILVVEDEDMVRHAIRRLLKKLGYQVLEASDGVAALALIEQGTSPIDLVLTDVQMPGMGGAQLAALLAGRRPRIPVLFMTGYAGEDTLRPDDEHERRRWLLKPFSSAELATAVRGAIDGTS